MIVLAIKLWGKWCQGKKLIFYCDNLNSVRAINSGCSRDHLLQKCLRELHIWSGVYSIEIKTEHIRSEDNRICDLLSRAHKSEVYKQKLKAALAEHDLKRFYIHNEIWQFFRE